MVGLGSRIFRGYKAEILVPFSLEKVPFCDYLLAIARVVLSLIIAVLAGEVGLVT